MQDDPLGCLILPRFVFQAYQLARRFHTAEKNDTKWDVKVEKMFRFCHR